MKSRCGMARPSARRTVSPPTPESNTPIAWRTGAPSVMLPVVAISMPMARAIIEVPMKARVFVSLKSTVLDPQGQTVRSALNGLGYHSISDVRQGKFFDIAIAGGVTREQARQDIETIAHEVLANPVIEECRVELLD